MLDGLRITEATLSTKGKQSKEREKLRFMAREDDIPVVTRSGLMRMSTEEFLRAVKAILSDRIWLLP